MLVLFAIAAFAADIPLSASVVSPESDQALNAYAPPTIPWVQVITPAQVAPAAREAAIWAFGLVEAGFGIVGTPIDVNVECGPATCYATVAPKITIDADS